MGSGGRTVTVVAVVLAVLVVATGVAAVVQTVRVDRALDRQEELEAKLAVAREQLDEAGTGAGPGTGEDDPDAAAEAEGLLDGLLGDSELGGLLDGLLGGGDALGDAAELAACAAAGDEQITIDDTDGQAQYDDIEEAVADIRDLAFADEVEPTYLSPAAITERITAAVEEEYTAQEADVDRRVLAAVGAIDPDRDLRQTQIDLLGGQVAGFYDSDTGEMVVGTADPDDPLNATDQVTLAHELTHALTDQALGLPGVLDEETPDSDAALAALALVEGDATLAMQRFAGSALDLGEQLGLATDPRAAGAAAQLSEFPYVLQRQLSFPYEEGLRFACALHRAGGWDAIDAAYDDLPTTSAQILFPERVAEPAPAAPPAPSDPGGRWRSVRTDTLGAAELKWLFEAPGDDPARALDEPRERVARWDGGTLEAWADGPRTAMGVVLREGPGEGPSLCDSVTTWYDRAFDDDAEAATTGNEQRALRGGVQSAVISCADDLVRVGIGPDLSTARAVAS